MLELIGFLLNFQNHIHNPLFWNSPGKNTRVGNHRLLQGIFLTWESNLGLLNWQADLLLFEPPVRVP